MHQIVLFCLIASVKDIIAHYYTVTCTAHKHYFPFDHQALPSNYIWSCNTFLMHKINSNHFWILYFTQKITTKICCKLHLMCSLKKSFKINIWITKNLGKSLKTCLKSPVLCVLFHFVARHLVVFERNHTFCVYIPVDYQKCFTLFFSEFSATVLRCAERNFSVS